MPHYVLDIGNTSVKAAVADQASEVIGAAPGGLPDLLGRPLRLDLSDAIEPRSFLGFISELRRTGQSDETDRWTISSVRRDAAKLLGTALAAINARNIRWLTNADIPIANQTEFPDKVGIDRLLASYGAMQFAIQNGQNIQHGLIAVQAGTAVTVDFTDATGAYCGGAIMAGLPLSLRLMAAGTDQLPDLGPIEIEDLPAIPGRNTRDAMLLGVSSALQGGVERLVARYRELAGFGCPVIYSGGDGFLACRDISAPAHHAPDLVLRSIAAI